MSSSEQKSSDFFLNTFQVLRQKSDKSPSFFFDKLLIKINLQKLDETMNLVFS